VGEHASRKSGSSLPDRSAGSCRASSQRSVLAGFANRRRAGWERMESCGCLGAFPVEVEITSPILFAVSASFIRQGCAGSHCQAEIRGEMISYGLPGLMPVSQTEIVPSLYPDRMC